MITIFYSKALPTSSTIGKKWEGLTVDGKKLALSITNAAHILSLSPWTLRRWIRLGRLKAVRLGRRVLVEPEELERLIASGRKTIQKITRRQT
jgi:excisionase family DNA binding protein